MLRLSSNQTIRTCFKKAIISPRSHSSLSSSTSSSTTTNITYGILGGLCITIVGGIKYINDHVGGSEGLKRTASFYSLAIPAYIQYRTHVILQSPDEIWYELDKDVSQKGLEKILELGGFYIKSGQMCAANIGNAFPKVWQDTMSVLQDKCPYKSFEVVQSIIESEYNQPLHEVFASFDKVPIGSASIGQVHRATLHNGQSVVVKVQYPEVESVFRGDVRTIKMFAQIAQPVHVPALDEVEKQFMTEFDYIQEAKQMNRVRDNLMKGNIDVVVPKAYLNLCTKSVLVMEELKGEKLADALKHDMERHAARVGMTPKEFQDEQERKHRDLKRKGISVRGPSALEYETFIKLLDTKRKMSNISAAFHNYSLGLLPGMSKKQYESRTSLPLNHAKIISDLVYIHGHEVLVDGYFNGDCHPGNILLLDVEKGKPKLGLIDYGQVKELTKSERLLMCRIIIALANDDRTEIIRLMKESGFKSKYMDENVIYKYAKVSYDEDNDELTDGKHIQMFMEDLQALDPIEKLPEQFIMVGRTSIMLRGLAHALQQSCSVAKAWKPIAQQVLRDELGEQF